MSDTEDRRRRALEADHLQALEGNPLTEEDKALFDMFEREGWSFERRRAHIDKLARQELQPDAAE